MAYPTSMDPEGIFMLKHVRVIFEMMKIPISRIRLDLEEYSYIPNTPNNTILNTPYTPHFSNIRKCSILLLFYTKLNMHIYFIYKIYHAKKAI